MKVIVFGANGMLGQYVVSYLRDQGEDVTEITRKELDIYKEWADKRLTLAISYELCDDPDWVINCSGITNKRGDISLEEMFVVNSLFPILLDKICFRQIVKQPTVIHASTDCVFSGANGEYSERSEPTANTSYGLSKFLGDQTLETCIIRTSIIGEAQEGRDNNSLLEWAKKNKGKEVQGYTQHFWNGITCLEWAKVAYEVMSEKTKIWSGVRHIASDSMVSKAKLLEMISEVYNLNLQIVSTRTDYHDMTLVSNRPNSIRRTSLFDQLQELKDYDISAK